MPASTASWRRSLPVIVAAVATVAAALLLWYLVDVVLLAFAGVLLALLLRAPADGLARRMPLSPGWALAVVVVVALSAAVAGLWLFGAGLAGQLGELVHKLPALVEGLKDRLAQYDWISSVLSSGDIAPNGKVIGRGIDALAATFGAVTYLVVVLFTGLFLAAQPGLYVRGALQLVPARARPRARQVLHELAHMLRSWLIGQVILMLAIGVVTFAGLTLLGVPMALALALLAGLLEFIPYLGPVLSAVPALLVALSQSPVLAGYTLLLYVAIQGLEGHILQPLVQRKTVSVPPALLLISQVVFGALVGVLGVMLATPATAALLVVVKRLYVEDVLNERA